jgi:hypothetical protein
MQLGIIVLTSLVSVGFHLAVMELIFTFYGNPENFYLSLIKLHQKLSKPLWYCPTCMASVWGTIGHFYLDGELYLWPVTVLSVAFLNTLLNKWVSN